MLLEFTCSNYRSIMNKIEFSFLASNDKTNEEELQVFGKYNILRTAVIHGANGSGKSNFIGAIGSMAYLVINSIQNQPGDHINQNAHKLLGNDVPTVFTIQFVKNNIRYSYGFSIKNNLIDKEYLYYFPKLKQTIIFEREGMKVIPGNKYKSSFALSLDALKENRLFLSCAANYTNIDEIKQAFMFFRNDLVFYDSDNNWIEYSIHAIQDSEINKQIFISFLNHLGTKVKDIKTTIEKINVSDLPADMPEAIKNLLLNGRTERNSYTVKLIYDQFETDLMTEESNGVKKLFEVLCPIIDILKKGKILICDELESSLHEAIVCEIIKMFKLIDAQEIPQLLFSTHDTSLLDSKLFRRDQIWFTELDENCSTDLYSLSEIRNVRKVENFRNGYILGKYGAIPCKSENLLSLFENELNRN